MRFTYAEQAEPARRAAEPRRPLQHVLTAVLGVMVAAAAWEITTFLIEYWRALHG